ncbi:MAG: hypothetical protein IPO69_00240 [Saprospiraceae bacterium]|nr:hypothetical protein [Saprospiraceae bacterium]
MEDIIRFWKYLSQSSCCGSESYLSTSTQKRSVGATRHCDFTMMSATGEREVVDWNEGKNVKVSVFEFYKMPGIATIDLDLSIGKRISYHALRRNGLHDEKRFLTWSIA